jgi:hypothetical protein
VSLSQNWAGVNDIAESKLSGVKAGNTPLSQFKKLLRLSLHLKRKSNQIQERVNYTTQDLGGKSLKNRGYLFDSAVSFTAESTSNLNILVNTQLHICKSFGVWNSGLGADV